MRNIAKVLICSALMLMPITETKAWWDEGHMQIAYVAYRQLDKSILDRVDALLRLNKDYDVWTAGAADDDARKLYAFVHAATWADDIKDKPQYKNDPISDPGATANLGYSDLNEHRYWHFKDIYFSSDGMKLPAVDPVNAVSQLKIIIPALGNASGVSDDVRSYDLVWIIHLVGDLHQPLHATARVAPEEPNGDQGGNLENVIPAGGELMSLHGYWDGLFGGYSSPKGAVFDARPVNPNGRCSDTARDGIQCVPVATDAANDLDPAHWAIESEALAEKFAYAAPVSEGTEPVQLTREYETNARNIGRARAALAGARLAAIVNAALK